MSVENTNRVNPDRPKRIALVVSNPAVSSTTGWPVGFWWSELTHPYLEFTEAGYLVDIYSPDGGPVVADAMSDPRDSSGYSAADIVSLGFIHHPQLMEKLTNTPAIGTLQIADYDALVVAGGQAPMFTFASATALQATFVAFYEQGKVVAALCHGTALLAYAKLSNGEYLVKGKTVTGFANAEEDFADQAVWDYGLLARDKHVMPWRIEDRLRELGANYIQGGLWRSFAVRDGNLVTGQQNFSGRLTAQSVIAALGQ
ncbi:type 1 glutamine amidotransferase domain-containing protein [Parvibium lacunae]|uniref:Type 1 glutamine amidotransferase domain-containing protein n=1 Tax=Parvibium lacunae TaxID=1888893 RepID=A0A368L0N9_9BURK|nr:type 1 glutamine amidotransferase domain-containing protein [Parvibium lacunae]RCS56967.1 type 1 glutamine amidotransferase domain-containing protein [Parvibium lacunae]